MKCKLDITACSDVAAWVTRAAFMRNVDPIDLACRESAHVDDSYHPDWFRRDAVGDLRFRPPAFAFYSGHLQGINGRHRAVLLCRHMETIPMLLVRTETWPQLKLREVILRRIEEEEMIELPDLPRRSHGHNQGEQDAGAYSGGPRSAFRKCPALASGSEARREG